MAKNTKVKEAPAPEKKRGSGIGELACKLIMEGKTNEEIIDAVQEAVPESRIGASSISWYRRDLRKKNPGVHVPSANEAKGVGGDGSGRPVKKAAAKAPAKTPAKKPATKAAAKPVTKAAAKTPAKASAKTPAKGGTAAKVVRKAVVKRRRPA